MQNSLIESFLVTLALILVQLAASVPWLLAIDRALITARFRSGTQLLITFGSILLAAVVLSQLVATLQNPDAVATWGRVYAFALQAQLTADAFVAVFFLLLKLWPKGGAVALASFRESVRQPMFWVLLLVGVVLLATSPFFPYFTFGEDLKMIKDLGFITIMFAGALFAVLTAGISISEEIEGRTAITVMSKPVSRRHFLLGKFLGILIASGLMVTLLGFLFVWVLLFAPTLTRRPGAEPERDPAWVVSQVQAVGSYLQSFLQTRDLSRGILLWIDLSGQTIPGLVMTLCQVMVLLAIAVALATRLPMVVNALVVLAVYFLGHLTHVLTEVSRNRIPLVAFLAQLFDYLLPSLDKFDMGPAVVRYAPLPPQEFGMYTANVALYAVVYTTIALLFGLYLFEDRDLA